MSVILVMIVSSLNGPIAVTKQLHNRMKKVLLQKIPNVCH